MTRKRSRLEIYLDILRAVKSGVNKPTNIMYKCNLSWLPLKRILETLIERDLLRMVHEKNRKIYEITQKGRDVLSYFEKAEELLVTEGRRGAGR